MTKPIPRVLVPHPIELRVVTVVDEGQEISEEQRKRVADWLDANGVDHRRVVGPVSIETKMRGDEVGRQVIGFREYYEDADGHRTINEKTLKEALTYERWVEQKVPLGPDPEWEGWDAWRAENQARADR